MQKQKVKTSKKHLPCPVCGFGRLVDASADNISELRAENSIAEDWEPDYFLKCPQCKSQIGIRKVR